MADLARAALNTWLDRKPLVIWGSVWGPQMAIFPPWFLLVVCVSGETPIVPLVQRE